uniref:BLL6 n=1 Tax=Spodoptera exigua TaxID=7107 RepID=A0A0H4T2H4_SPOEX|nr:BLL6 [Spodoptera exigua]
MIKSIYLMLLPVVLGTFLPDDKSYPNLGPQNTETQVITFHRDAATFDEAQKICKQNGGRIAVITSSAQEAALVQIFKTSGPVINASYGWNLQAFIGIQYSQSGQWQTLDGKPAPYLNWSRNAVVVCCYKEAWTMCSVTSNSLSSAKKYRKKSSLVIAMFRFRFFLNIV